MLKRLRLKFIIINMTIVTVMLLVIFGLLYYSTQRNLEEESLRMMQTVADSPLRLAPPGTLREDVRLPYFAVMINRAGEAVEVGGGFFDLSDEGLLDELLRQTYAAHEKSGVLKEYHLRYVRSESVFGQCIVYADMTSELSTLQNLVRTFVMIGLAAFLVFLGISVALARWAVRPVAKAWEQQKQFVADASHELKTPLTVIMTDAELIGDADCSDAERFSLSDSITAMAVQMRGLVENLLELARIDDSSFRKTKSEVSFSDAVTNAAMLFEPVFFEKELPFRSEIEPGILLEGNAAHLKQLAETLLDNAVKYAAPGGETVISLRRSGHRHCTLEVADQGPEIPAENLKHLLERFYRADQARAMNHSYGLGLAIAESIVGEHRGSIRAESADGWNRFIAELPIQK